ncbi:MAG: alanine--tRNA ligase, partial [Candidatus Marinimicrobia bacterium]|nr:alanine--tRNA ligase [Candidatus Neomarinimicrobiota bacterium]
DKAGKLNELPQKHVDTGMGLERLTAIVQGKSSNYDTDIFSPIIKEIEIISGKKYEGEDQSAFRVIADHLRSLSFSIADGVIPSNEGRGYVVRRLLRRAAKFGRNLGLDSPFIYKLVTPLTGLMGDIFPELRERKEHIERIIKSEEESFGETIDRGMELFEQLTVKMNKKSSKLISGEDAFKLYDTYGFPIDLTSLMARERGLSVDLDGFDKAMTEQKVRSRQKKKFAVGNLVPEGVEIKGEPTLFLGYEKLKAKTEITQILFQSDKDIRLLLKETPYYAESGGQIGDNGIISAKGLKIRINDTQKYGGSHYVHIGEVLEGDPKLNMKVTAEVNSEWRRNILLNHTATHLMHAALRIEFGDHVEQAGSLVAPDRLRFDYHHFERPTSEQLKNIESVVNEKIRENIKLKTTLTTFENAKKLGAMALFGEKYGDEVRMVEIDNFSKELCGGTHVERTGDIGLFLITHESSVSSGVRRIEAVTGVGALKYIQENKSVLSELENHLSVKSEQLPERIKSLSESNKALERKLRKLKSSDTMDIESWIDPNNKIGAVTLVARRLEAASLDEMKGIADRLRDELKSGVGVLASEIDNKAFMVVIVTQDIIKSEGISAKKMIEELAEVMGGGGGGNDRIATAGGGKPELIEKALSQSSQILSKLTQ